MKRLRFLLLAACVLTLCTQAVAQTNLARLRNALHVSLAYRIAAIKKMAAGADLFSRKLHLQIELPVTANRVRASDVAPPSTGLSGWVAVDDFQFCFGGGILWDLRSTERDAERFDLYPTWVKMHSLVSSNGAYQLATQWLASISVDVPALERKFKPRVSQWYFHHISKDPWAYPHAPTSTNITLLPIFDVKWGKGLFPAVKVTVFGPTKELIELEMHNTSFCRRPRLVITNAAALNRIPDPPLAHLRQLLRERLTNTAPGNTNAPSTRPPPFHLTVKPIPK